MIPSRGHRMRLVMNIAAPSLTTTAMLVLVILNDRAGRDGVRCVIGLKRIAEQARCSVSTARRAVQLLATLGLIAVEDRERPDGSRASCGYRLDWSAIERAQPAQMTLPYPENEPRRVPVLPRRARRFERGPLSQLEGGSEPPYVNQKNNNDEAQAPNAAARPEPVSSSCCDVHSSDRASHGSRADNAADRPSGAGIDALIGAGFAPPEARRLAEQAGDWGASGGIADAIEGSKRPGTRNPRGFIVAAIRNRWAPAQDIADERERRARAARNAELAQREQERRVEEMRRRDAAIDAERAAIDAYCRGMDPLRFERAAREAIERSNEFMRLHTERKLRAGAQLIDLPSVRSLVWNAAGQPASPTNLDHPRSPESCASSSPPCTPATGDCSTTPSQTAIATSPPRSASWTTGPASRRTLCASS